MFDLWRVISVRMRIKKLQKDINCADNCNLLLCIIMASCFFFVFSFVANDKCWNLVSDECKNGIVSQWNENKKREQKIMYVYIRDCFAWERLSEREMRYAYNGNENNCRTDWYFDNWNVNIKVRLSLFEFGIHHKDAFQLIPLFEKKCVEILMDH